MDTTVVVVVVVVAILGPVIKIPGLKTKVKSMATCSGTIRQGL